MVALLAALALLLAACGSDEDDTGTAAESEESSDTSAAETEDSSDASAAETEDSSESDEAMEDDEESTDISAAEAEESSESDDATEAEAGDALPIELGEWFVGAPEGITAGTLTFTVENVGENPHAFAIARGTSYEELPQKENGAVDTDALGDAFLGTTENIEPGASGTIEFELAEGDYVFFCPIEFGPNSHAGAGQVLSVNVGS